MLVHKLIFQLETGPLKKVAKGCLGGSFGGLLLHVAPSAENRPAALALDNGVSGWAIGEFENGAMAILALESHLGEVVVHDPSPL